MSANIISNFVDIAPNEYFTKYSFNRNFNKLISNDINLFNSTVSDSDTNDPIGMLSSTQTYNKQKTYQNGECVFYKIQYDDTKFYILSSCADGNTHKPMVRKNDKTGELYVINSDYWKILGIPSTQGESKPKDKADVQMNEDLTNFKVEHELNTTTLSAHPTGKLGLKESTKTFLTLENITDDRQNLFYPNVIQSFVADNTTYSGYMRKWDNGLLEYDVVFRLGYISSDAEGYALLSANNLVVPNANKNFMYFKDDKDYEIFNQGGENYVVTETTKQVNLNKQLNAYSGKISFIEPFKDLNYMVFTSGSKVIETEAYNMKTDPIVEYDSRLDIQNRSIVGVQPDSRFKLLCHIPNSVLNIGYEALANIEMVDDEPVRFEFDVISSNLINISQRAFMNTELFDVSIPASTKYIGKQAFDGCNNLSLINIYLSTQDSANKQIHIGENAFTENVVSVNVIYLSSQQSGSPQDDLYAWLLNSNNRKFVGLTTNPNNIQISAVNRWEEPQQATFASPMALKALVQPISQQTSVSHEDETLSVDADEYVEPIISIDVNDFIYQLQHPANKETTPKRSLLKAIRPLASYDQVFLSGSSQTILTGCNTSFIYEDFGIDFANKITSPSVILESTITSPTAISDNALKNLTTLTGLTSTVDLTSIGSNSLPTSLKNLQLNLIDNNYSFDLRNHNIDNLTISVNNNPTSLSLNAVGANIGTLNLVGNGNTTLQSNALSISHVDMLILSGFNTLATSAFGCISSINNATLHGNNSNGTSIYRNLFHLVDDDDGTHAAVDNIDLRNDSWTLCANSFQYAQIPYLSIDMHNTMIAPHAFDYAGILQLMLSNATSSDFTGGNSAGMFSAKQINYVTIPNQTFLTASYSATKMKNVGFKNQTMITIGDETKILSIYNNVATYNDMPTYLGITNKRVSSFDSTKWKNLDINKIDIPYGISGINDGVFSSANVPSDCISAIQTITIPKTVKSIGQNAFNGLSDVGYVWFEPGIEFVGIGNAAFDNCRSLYEFIVRK